MPRCWYHRQRDLIIILLMDKTWDRRNHIHAIDFIIWPDPAPTDVKKTHEIVYKSFWYENFRSLAFRSLYQWPSLLNITCTRKGIHTIISGTHCLSLCFSIRKKQRIYRQNPIAHFRGDHFSTHSIMSEHTSFKYYTAIFEGHSL